MERTIVPTMAMWTGNGGGFLTALCRTLPFFRTCGDFLLSPVECMQTAILFEYLVTTVRWSMPCAVRRVLSGTPGDVHLSIDWVS